jgi:putative endonuclease
LTFYVYILKSIKDGSYYIGQTSNLKERLKQHNRGYSSFTKLRKPYELIYKNSFETRKEAVKKERELKKKKSKIWIDNFIIKNKMGL